MNLGRLIRPIVFLAGGLAGLVLVAVVLLTLVRIPIDLTSHKGLVESAIGRFLDRQVSVDGKLEVTTSLWPLFQMDGLRIGNPEGFGEGEFATMKHASIQLGVLPLLKGNVHVETFDVKQLLVTLRESADGTVNWSNRNGGHADVAAGEADAAMAPPAEGRLSSDSFVLKRLTLADISVSFQSASMAEPAVFQVQEGIGNGPVGEPFTLAIKGALLNEAFSTTIELGSIEELLEDSRSWMKVDTEIAGSLIKFEGEIDLARVNHSLRLQALVQGEDLSSLNGLLDLDLPPLKSYSAGAAVTWKKDRFDLKDFEVQIGKSRLIGSGTIDGTGPIPVAKMQFDAPLIQLDDFDVGDWSADQGKPQEKKKADRGKGYAGLLSPGTLGRFGFDLQVSAKQVLSGTDELGSGTLKATLDKGRFSLDPIKLVLPGGSMLFAMSIRPGKTAAEASVRAQARNFDFGILARRTKPGTDMGGTLNLDVDLKSRARHVGELLANAKGHFDFSGLPVNLHAGIIDLWAVNLIAAIASKGDDKGSTINCVVGRWSMQDGILRPDTFVIDTTAMRICGTGQTDFKTETVDLTAAPTAKKPEYFSLATPIAIRGSFEDFELGVRPGGILQSTASFVTSPVHATLRKLLGDKLPENGEDVCGMEIGADNRPESLPKGCRTFSLSGG